MTFELLADAGMKLDGAASVLSDVLGGTMPRTQDMFAELKPPRKKPEKLMHVCDAGGCCEEDGSGAMVRMACQRCGHETDWMYLATVTEAKRGKPCPVCNSTPNARGQGSAACGASPAPTGCAAKPTE